MCSSHQSNRLRRESSGGNREWEVERKSLMLCAQTDCLGLQFGVLMCDRWSVSAWGIFLVGFGSVTVSLNKTWPEEENVVCYWVSVCMLFLSVGGLVLYIININNGDSVWWGRRDLIAVMHAYSSLNISMYFPKAFPLCQKNLQKVFHADVDVAVFMLICTPASVWKIDVQIQNKLWRIHNWLAFILIPLYIR